MSLTIWILLSAMVVLLSLHVIQGLGKDSSLWEYAFWLVALSIFGNYSIKNFKLYRFNKNIDYVELLEKGLSLSSRGKLEIYGYENVMLAGYTLQFCRSKKDIVAIDSRLFENTIELMNNLHSNIEESN